MKRVINILMIFAIFVSTLTFAHDGANDLGGKEAHGGDSYTLNFNGVADVAISYFEHHNKSFTDFDLQTINTLRNIFKNVKVESYYRICLNEKTYEYREVEVSSDCSGENEIEKDAINIKSENKIIISRNKWQFLDDKLVKKTILIFHELLCLVDDRDYKGEVTAKLENFINQNVESYTNWFIQNFGFYYVDQKYLCLISGVVNGKMAMQTYEMDGEKTYSWFDSDMALSINRENQLWSKGKGESLPKLTYKIFQMKNKDIRNSVLVKDETEINFNGKNKVEIYLSSIKTLLKCFKIEAH